MQSKLSSVKRTIESFFFPSFLPHENTGGNKKTQFSGGVYIFSYGLLFILNSPVFQNRHVQVFTLLSACFQTVSTPSRRFPWTFKDQESRRKTTGGRSVFSTMQPATTGLHVVFMPYFLFSFTFFILLKCIYLFFFQNDCVPDGPCQFCSMPVSTSCVVFKRKKTNPKIVLKKKIFGMR